MLVILNTNIIVKTHPISKRIQKLWNKKTNKVYLQIGYDAEGKEIQTYEDIQGNYFEKGIMDFNFKELTFLDGSLRVTPLKIFPDIEDENNTSFEFNPDSKLIKLFEETGGEGFEIMNTDTWNKEASKLFADLYFLYDEVFYEVMTFTRFFGHNTKITFNAKPTSLLCL